MPRTRSFLTSVVTGLTTALLLAASSPCSAEILASGNSLGQFGEVFEGNIDRLSH